MKSKKLTIFIGILTIASSFGCISLKGDITLVNITTNENQWCFNSSWDACNFCCNPKGSAIMDAYVNSSIGYIYGQRDENVTGSGQANGEMKHWKEWNCTVENKNGTINISYEYNAYAFLVGNLNGITQAKLWLTFFIDDEQHEVVLYNNTISNINESDVFKEHSVKNWSINRSLDKKTYIIGVKASFEIDYTGNNTQSIAWLFINVPNTKQKEVDENTEYWAVLIGVDCMWWEEGLFPPPHIPFYENADEIYRMILVSNHWQVDHIKVLTKDEATLANIIGAFLWLDKMDDGDDVSLVYYSSHGGNLHNVNIFGHEMDIDLPPFDEADGYDEYLTTYLTTLKWYEFLWDDLFNILLSRLDSTVGVIIDACFSGGMIDSDKATWIQEFSGEIYQNGRVITTCSAEAEPGIINPANGITFSDYMFDGLKGYADISEGGNSDGVVSLEEAFAYAGPKYQELTGGKCNPVIDDQCPGELIIMDADLPANIPNFPGDLVTIGQPGISFVFNSESIDPEDDTIKYGWDWNKDGFSGNNQDTRWWGYWEGYELNQWSDFYCSGDTCTLQHSWNEPGVYAVRVKAQDEHGAESTENIIHMNLWSKPRYFLINDDDEIIDQYLTYSNCTGRLWYTYAQSFITTTTTLSKIKLKLALTPTYINLTGYGDYQEYPLEIYIRNSLTGENLASVSRKISSELQPGQVDWVEFDFPDIIVTPNSPYFIVIKSNTNYPIYEWAGCQENQVDYYHDGEAFYYSSSGWNNEGYVNDFCFITYESGPADTGGPYYGLINKPIQFSGLAFTENPPYSWLWHFGDDTTSTLQNPTHTYANPDCYTVILTVTDNAGITTGDVTQAYIKESNNPPDAPSIPSGPEDCQIGKYYDFSTITTDPDGDKVKYKWDWDANGDHEYETTDIYDSGETCTTSHLFDNLGWKQIKVQAIDIYGGESDWSGPLNVHIKLFVDFNLDLNQYLSTSLMKTVVGQSTQFYGYAYGGTGSYSWSWDVDYYNREFGEHTSSLQNPVHTYHSCDNYTVKLTVTDRDGNVGNCTKTVKANIINAKITTYPQYCTKPYITIHFNDTSSGIYSIENWKWDFNDGTISYARNLTHRFVYPGDYNVSLTVEDSQSHTDHYNQIIQIIYDSEPPEIKYVFSFPHLFGSNFTTAIGAVVSDRQSTIKNMNVSIIYPNNASRNFTMNHLVDDTYWYVFNNTLQIGQYNYSIWVTDSVNNINHSTEFSFTVVPQPFLKFDAPPTPGNQTVLNHNWVLVNTTVQDDHNTSAFINWNHNLKGYWPMESYNDTGVYDNSTYENFGIFQSGMNTRNIIPGKYGDGLEFDGSDDYLDVGTSDSLNLGMGDFTFMVWEKSHTTSYSKKAMILTNNPAMESWKGYGFGVMNNPYLIVSQSAGSNVTLQGATDVTDNTWHHIAYVCRSGEYSIYVDGEEDANSGGIAVKNITNAQHTMIAYDGHCSSWCYFDGALDEPQLYNRALGWEEINASYNNGLYRLSHNFTGLPDGTYSYYAHAIDTTGNQSSTETRQILIDTTPPTITNVNASPHIVGFGYNVTVTADVVDNGSGVDLVTIQIIPPSGVGNSSNYTMTLVSNSTYQYAFTNTWSTGQYNYTIWATDDTNNTASSSGHHFHVSAQATISIATLRNTYTGNQYINITDPPNPPEDYILVDRGLTWNTYYNATSGENILETYQGPVNYQEENETWTPINNTITQLGSNHPAYVYGYRQGNDRGLFGTYFKSNAQQEWPIAFTYNKSNDPTVHAIRSKLVGVGYVDPQSNWAYQYLQNVQNSQGQTNDYSITYPGVFTGTDVTWSYGNTGLKEEITLSNTTKTILQNHPPSQYGLNDASSYLVFITRIDYQNLNLYNSSGMLNGNVTVSDAGLDFKDALGQFKCALPLGEAYELNNESARQKLTYRIVHFNGNTYLLSGLKVSDLNAMIFPVVVDPTLTVYSISSDGHVYNSGTSYTTVHAASTGTVDGSGAYITIGQKKIFPGTYYIYRGFVFFNTSTLPSNAYLDDATLSLYKKDDYSTTDFDITIQNGQPTYPRNPMQSADYYKNYYSGNGGTLSTSGFTNGYNAIRMNNLSWINKTGITKLCLRSSRDISGTAPTGNEYVNVYSNEFLGMNPPKLVINYRNQSKIKNTGSTNIKGYLLIQVQFYNSTQGKWLVDDDTINETTARTITSGNQLALDAIFNGHVRASDLTHGTGTYRVYAAFRDPEGNILRTNDDVDLEAWWQFSKT